METYVLVYKLAFAFNKIVKIILLQILNDLNVL